jgi:predicted nuclease of predicted toxin-antitoxin system
MKFKIDENLPIEVKELLIAAGHDALLVSDQQLEGKPDQLISEVCQLESRAIITLDLDFADIRSYPPAQYAGIIVLRLRRQDKLTVIAVIKELLNIMKLEKVEHLLWIVDEQRVRIRE